MTEPDFSFRRDFKSIQWKQTLSLCFIRSVFAGLVWFVVFYFLTLNDPSAPNPAVWLLFPIMYFIFFLPTGLLCSWLSSVGVPWVGLFSGLVAVLVTAGDPLVKIIHKTKPGIVPVDEFGYFNFKLVIFVIDESE